MSETFLQGPASILLLEVVSSRATVHELNIQPSMPLTRRNFAQGPFRARNN